MESGHEPDVVMHLAPSNPTAATRAGPVSASSLAREDSAIWADEISKHYGHRAALDRLSFSVPRGVVTGFVGPNGAGKSTTMRALLGLVRLTGGRAEVLGHPVSRPAAFLGRVGALVEAPAAYRALSGRRNLEIVATLKGVRRQRVADVLEQVGLADRGSDRVKAYSLGMRQRLAIAAALLPEPELLMLDEPVNGLDPEGIHEMRDMLRGLAGAGTAVFISSHLLSEVEQICDWLVIIRGGHEVYIGPIRNLLDMSREGLMVATATPEGYAALERVCAAAGYQTSRREGQLHVDCPLSWAGELNRRAMEAGVVLTELVHRQARLEDVFLDIISEKKGEAGHVARDKG